MNSEYQPRVYSVSYRSFEKSSNNTGFQLRCGIFLSCKRTFSVNHKLLIFNLVHLRNFFLLINYT